MNFPPPSSLVAGRRRATSSPIFVPCLRAVALFGLLAEYAIRNRSSVLHARWPARSTRNATVRLAPDPEQRRASSRVSRLLGSRLTRISSRNLLSGGIPFPTSTYTSTNLAVFERARHGAFNLPGVFPRHCEATGCCFERSYLYVYILLAQ